MQEENPFFDSRSAEPQKISTEGPHEPESAAADSEAPGVAHYVGVPGIRETLAPRGGLRWSDGIEIWFVLIALVVMEALKRSARYGAKYAHVAGAASKLAARRPLACAAGFLAAAAIVFEYPNATLVARDGRLTALSVLGFSIVAAGAAAWFAMLAVGAAKRYRVFLHAPEFKVPGQKYLQMGLMATTATAALFFWATESRIAFWALFVAAFSYSWFSLAKAPAAEYDARFGRAGEAMFPAAIAVLGAACGWWPVMICGIAALVPALGASAELFGRARPLFGRGE